MASKTIAEWQQSILDGFAADVTLSGETTSTSKTALYRLVARVIAVCAWTVDELFDTVKTYVNEIIATLKPHSLRWYANIAKNFQYGFALPIDSDVYDNTGYTTEQIDDSKIAAYVAVTEQDRSLRIKVAKQGATDLEPFTVDELTSFSEYMGRVKDAGVKLNIESNDPDKLRLSLQIYYDPLIINSLGQRIDGTDSEPVQNAVKDYLKNLPFNGTFVLAYLTDALQVVDGVVIPHIVSCETQYAGFAFASVQVKYLPDAGYLRFEDEVTDLEIEFIPQTQLQ